MKLTGFLKNKTVKNAGWIIGGRLANKALAFLVSILTARYLGPSNNGLIGYVTAYITFFASLCNLGINSVIIKDFVDHPEEEGEAIGTTLVLRMVSSALSAVMIIGIVWLMDRDPLTVLVAALSTLGLLFQVFDTFKKWFQSRLQSKYVAVGTLVAYVAVSAYRLELLAMGKSVSWFALATSVDYLAVAVFLLWAYKRKGGPRLRFSMKKAKQLLRISSSYIIAGVMVSVYASTDKLMLKQLLDEASVGYYVVAVSLSTTWTFLLEAVVDSMYPSVIQAYDKDKALFERRNRQLYAIVLYAALFVSLVISLLARPLISVLYGEAYLPTVTPLRIICWYSAFSYLGVARNAWMVCENKQKYLKYLYIAAAVINVGLNLLLIPLWGPSGAAAASLVTQIFTTVCLPAMIPPLRPNAKLMVDAMLLRGLRE